MKQHAPSAVTNLPTQILSGVPGAEPLPGDFTVCINCGGVLQFTVGEDTRLTVKERPFLSTWFGS